MELWQQVIATVIAAIVVATPAVLWQFLTKKPQSDSPIAPPINDNLPISEAKTSADSSPAIITSGPNSNVTVNYNLPKSKTKKVDENKLNISPGEIYADIESRPLFQQNDARRYYIGLKVKWRLNLSSVSILDEKTARLFLLQKETHRMICSDIKISRYPQLKVARNGLVIWVSGKISNVDVLGIDLSDVSLEFE